MTLYLLRKTLGALLTLVFASVIVFSILHLLPGDPAQQLAGEDATPDVLEAIRKSEGLDRPLPIQYLEWIGRAIRGDLGTSYVSQFPTVELLGQALPATLELAVLAFVLSIVVGIPAGIVAAARAGRLSDFVVKGLAAGFLAMPQFWVGVMVLLLFALKLGWLPPGGRVTFGEDPVEALKTMILPTIILGLPSMAILARFMRTAILSVQDEDFVLFGIAKGLPRRLVFRRYIFRNALLPVVTIAGINFGRMVAGAVLVEQVFVWPGIGRLLVQSIASRDYAVIQGVLLMFVLAFVLINLLVDVLYAVIDPRTRRPAAGRA